MDREVPVFFYLVSGFFDDELADADQSELDVKVENDLEERKDKILAYVHENQASRAKARTACDMRKFQTFLAPKGVTEPIEKIKPNRLDILLAEFFKDVKRDDVRELEPGTLKGIQYSIEMYLCEHRYEEKVTKSALFSLSQLNQLYTTKMKILKGLGKGNRPNRAQCLLKMTKSCCGKKASLVCTPVL